MQTVAAPSVTDLIDGYIATWNETDSSRRRELIAATWTDDAIYIDPLSAAEGPDAIDGLIAATQDQFPGYEFRLLGQPDSHSGYVRFAWELFAPGATESLVAGSDYGVIANDGRLRCITGFLDKVPA